MGERAFCKIKIYRRNHFSDMRTKTENIILESRLLEGCYRDEDECGACLLILEKQWIALKKGLTTV